MRSNVLLLASGRQSIVIEQFRRATAPFGSTIVADVDSQAPARDLADWYLSSPPFSSMEYLTWILHACEEHDVGLVVTFHEADLSRLETVRRNLEALGVALLGCPNISVGRLTDKLWLAQELARAGLESPPTLASRDLENADWSQETLAKPRVGRASRGHRRFENLAQALTWRARDNEASGYVFQPFMAGDEYGMDVINNLKGEYVGYLARRKLRMVDGETNRAVTTRDTSLASVASQLAAATRHLGPIDVDLIKQRDRFFVIDVNPRFGGGYAFNAAAGADIPAQVVTWWRGGETSQERLDYLTDVIYQRRSRVEAVAASATNSSGE